MGFKPKVAMDLGFDLPHRAVPRPVMPKHPYHYMGNEMHEHRESRGAEIEEHRRNMSRRF